MAPDIYIYDRDGIFYEVRSARPDVKRPGEWVLPSGATWEAPPEIPEGMCAVWDGAAWNLVDIPAPPEEAMTAEEALALLLGLAE